MPKGGNYLLISTGSFLVLVSHLGTLIRNLQRVDIRLNPFGVIQHLYNSIREYLSS